MPKTKTPALDRSAYTLALQKFDAAVCEATAVSQATASRFVATNVGYASYVFPLLAEGG